MKRHTHRLLKEYIQRLLTNHILLEARSKRIEDLKAPELIDLIDFLLGKNDLLDITEKLAGQHKTITLENGNVLESIKDADYDWRSKYEDIFKPVARKRDVTYRFEQIKANRRPDYVNYFIENDVWIEYTGNMTEDEAELYSSRSNITFLTKDAIRRKTFDIEPGARARLEELRQRLEGRTNKAVRKEIAMELAQIIFSGKVESALGGGIEGLWVTGGQTEYKIPAPAYRKAQKLQAKVYAIWSRKSRVSPTERVRRFISGPGDAYFDDAEEMLEWIASGGVAKGYRAFFSPTEAERMLELMETEEGRRQAANEISRRVDNRSAWWKA